MKLADLVPKDDADYGAERMFICGDSGNGKSTLEDKIISAIPATRDKKNKVHKWCVVIVDTKQDWPFKRLPWQKGRYLALPTTDLRVVPDGFYVYRPTHFPEAADEGCKRIFRTALKRKYCVIVVDEGGDFGTTGTVELGKLIRQARSKHVILIFGAQRPSGVMLLSITQATILVEFGLGSKDDYDRMAKWANPNFALPPDGEHDFSVYDKRTKKFSRVRQA